MCIYYFFVYIIVSVSVSVEAVLGTGKAVLVSDTLVSGKPRLAADKPLLVPTQVVRARQLS